MTHRHRQRLLAHLLREAEVMIQGSFSRTYRTCGRPGCRCQRGEKHGPHTYLTFRGPAGKTRSLYVPEAELGAFEEATAAWDRFKQVAEELARENRDRVARRRKTSKRRRSDARET